MRINEDFLDVEPESSLVQNDDNKLRNRGEYHDYPYRLGFCYFDIRYQTSVIAAKVEEYLDACPYITEFSNIDVHFLPKRFSNYLYVNFGFVHKFRSPG